MTDHEITYTITRGDDDIELIVGYSVSRFYPARGPSWGCPGEPAEGGEITELEITLDGRPFELTDAEMRRVEDHIYQSHDYSEEYEYA